MFSPPPPLVSCCPFNIPSNLASRQISLSSGTPRAFLLACMLLFPENSQEERPEVRQDSSILFLSVLSTLLTWFIFPRSCYSTTIKALCPRPPVCFVLFFNYVSHPSVAVPLILVRTVVVHLVKQPQLPIILRSQHSFSRFPSARGPPFL